MKYSSRFLSSAQQGKSGIQHYLLGLVVILLFLILCSLLILIYSTSFLGVPLEEFNNFALEKQSLELQHFFLIFVCLGLCCGFFFTTATVHQRHAMTLVNLEGEIRWKQIVSGFTIWFLANLLTSLLFYVFNTERYLFSDRIIQVILTLPFSLSTTFATAAFYCVFFAYVLQGLNRIIRNQLILILTVCFLISAIYMFQEFDIKVFLLSFIFQGFILFSIVKFDGIEVVLGLIMADLFYSLSIVQPIANGNDPLGSSPSLAKASPIPDHWWIPAFLIQISIFYYSLSKISLDRSQRTTNNKQ
ncbi:MAG: hypothetical protein SW833_17345 [Cyanobacteriota bacterium]|nr:hypothetical protein [Cyanobacteriota bacterium]